ncbi:hypothetical protein GWK41_08875 [Persephonella atlantica]|uniref:Uncharacterized protein n=1 Tax=Persephonella atlantica TaxID=2699429 RepID=A0ABS1GJS3_9AQUI|nr:O-antigen ligase family protein [Persephonella atlantica]MBK3333183.1 hypothetical protein [Persephonella atlantica]
MKYPVLTFSAVSMFSTVLFAPKMIFKAVEEGIFQLIYFYKTDVNRRTVRNVIYLFVFIGIFLLPVVFFKYFTVGETRPIWGGTFEVGQFYAEFALMTVLLGIAAWKEKDNRKIILYAGLFFIFAVVLILTHRRSPILGFFIIFVLLSFILSKNGIINKKIFAGLIISSLVVGVSGYIYLSQTDVRFKTLNNVIMGKEPLNYHTLNRISSARVGIGYDAVKIIQNDIKEGNYINLLIGHGVRSGYYLPHERSPKTWVKYESVFILSEFIEKGIVGLIAELFIIFIAFKTFLTVKIRENADIIALGLFIPLLIHIIGSVFTFFWDALLPLYLLLFKLGELYFSKRAEEVG